MLHIGDSLPARLEINYTSRDFCHLRGLHLSEPV
jgi:hypothetical protein